MHWFFCAFPYSLLCRTVSFVWMIFILFISILGSRMFLYYHQCQNLVILCILTVFLQTAVFLLYSWHSLRVFSFIFTLALCIFLCIFSHSILPCLEKSCLSYLHTLIVILAFIVTLVAFSRSFLPLLISIWFTDGNCVTALFFSSVLVFHSFLCPLLLPFHFSSLHFSRSTSFAARNWYSS